MSNEDEKWWEHPRRFVGNKLVLERDGYVIRQYGCCGRFAFLVGDAKTRRILKLPIFTLEDANKYIDDQIKKLFLTNEA